MKKIKIKRIVTAFILLLVLQPVVNAITIKPTVVEMSVEPGQKGSGHFFIQNNTTSKVLISVEPETFTGKNID
ncbi:MAG: hypothetical protein KKH98_01700, partial [Spirochaetes bacterium]|nr:hypothetical protein [Spirochaetota bacterium]